MPTMDPKQKARYAKAMDALIDTLQASDDQAQVAPFFRYYFTDNAHLEGDNPKIDGYRIATNPHTTLWVKERNAFYDLKDQSGKPILDALRAAGIAAGTNADGGLVIDFAQADFEEKLTALIEKYSGAVVRHSNQIIARLQDEHARFDDIAANIATLPNGQAIDKPGAAQLFIAQRKELAAQEEALGVTRTVAAATSLRGGRSIAGDEGETMSYGGSA